MFADHSRVKTKRRRQRNLALQNFQEKDCEAFEIDPSLCPQTHHKRERLKFFCKLCRVCACQECVRVEHFQHEHQLIDLDVAAKETRKTMETSVGKSQQKEQALAEIVRKMEQKLDEYEDNACARGKIDKFSEELVTQIKNDDELVKQITDCYLKSETELRDKKTRILIEVESFKKFLAKTEKEMERCTSAEVISLDQNLEQRLNEVTKLESESTSLLDSVDTRPTFLFKEKVIDTVTGKKEDAQRKKMIPDLRILYFGLFALLIFGLYLPIFPDATTTSNSIWEVALNNKGEIIVTDFWDHKLRVFSGKGFFSYHGTFGRKGRGRGEFACPLGLAITDKNDVFVADRNNHRIVVLKEGMKYSNSFGGKGSRPGQLLYPTGVSLDEEENIIVSDTGNHRIQVFSKQGRLTLSFGDSGEGKLIDPVQCVSIGGRFFVSEVKEYNIKVYDSQGKFLFKFAEQSDIYKMYHKILVWFNVVDPIPAGHSGHTYRLTADINRHLLVVTDPVTYRVQYFNTDGILVKNFWFIGGSSLAVAMNGREYATVRNFLEVVQVWNM